MKNDLFDFMQSATNDMAEEYKRIQKRASEDPGTAGDQGEENWATLLRNWLPPLFQIVTKGRIINHMGDTSPQVDILVLQPEYPKHLLDKKLYLAGGVLAALECKITLRTEHIERFFDNSIKIRKLLPKRYGTPYREMHSSIIYGLLSHSYESNNSPNVIQSISKKLDSLNNEKIESPLYMPDFICVADLSYWYAYKTAVNNPVIYDEQEDTAIEINSRYCHAGYINEGCLTETMNTSFTPMGGFITNFFKRLSFEYSPIQSIARHFNFSGLNASGSGISKQFSLDFFSEKVKKRLIENPYNRQQKWDEWVLSF